MKKEFAIRFCKMKEEEIAEIYQTYMVKDFPDAELKPLAAIHRMMKEGIYDSLAVYAGSGEENEVCVSEEDTNLLIGYALVVQLKEEPYGLLDYFGILEEQRNGGYGQAVLHSLREFYGNRILLIESEYPMDAPNPAMAKRRIHFYERNGAIRTEVESEIFGMHYYNFLLPGKKMAGEPLPKSEKIIHMLDQIYTCMVPEENVRKQKVKFF